MRMDFGQDVLQGAAADGDADHALSGGNYVQRV